MRTPLGVVLIGALAAALSPLVAFSSTLALPAYDLRAQLFLRLFGETTDWRASVAAAHGDPYGESPLRDLALAPKTNQAPAEFLNVVASATTFASVTVERRAGDEQYFDLAQTARERLLQDNAAIAAPGEPSADATAADVGTLSTAQPGFTVAAYQPVQAPASVTLQSGALSFSPTAPSGQSVASAMLPGAATARVSSPATLRFGPVHVEGQVQGSSAQVRQPSLLDSAYGAGANFAVRAGARNVDVGVTGSYEQLTRNDAALAGSSLSAQWELPGGDAALVIPGAANMSRVSLAAGVAVPLINGLTLNLNYDTARLLGSYGLPGLTNLDAVDNAYGGGLTFAIPHSSSTLSFSAYQYRYQDNILNANSLTQTRENVNFTVKF
jgi:hypothetical protein